MAEYDDPSAHDERELERLLRFLTRPGLDFALALALFAEARAARRIREQALARASLNGCRVVPLDLQFAGDDADLVEIIAGALAEAGAGAGADAVFVLGLDALLTDTLGRPRRPTALVNLNLRRDELPALLTGRVVLWVGQRAYAQLAKVAWDLLEVTLTRFEFVGREAARVELAKLDREPVWLEPAPEDQIPRLRERADAWLARAASARDPRAKADALASAASSLVALGEFDRGEELLEQAVKTFGQVPDLAAAARQRIRLASLLRQLGRYDRAEHEATIAARSAAGIGDWNLEVKALQLLADVHRGRGENDVAERALEQIIAGSEVRGDRRNLAVALGKLGSLHAARASEDAEPLLERAAAIFAEIGQDHGWANTRSRIADLRLAQGRVDEARDIYVGEVVPVLERRGDEAGLALVRGRIARTFAAEGELERALMILQTEELPIYERAGDRVGALQTRLVIAELLVRNDQLADALALLDNDILPAARALSLPRFELVALLELAHALELDHQLPEALARLDEARQLAERLSLPLGATFDEDVERLRARVRGSA